jgi:hypothetical protein
MRILPAPGRAARLAFVLGGLILAYGSITSVPASWPGQVVLSAFAGAAFVTVGALRLAALLALRPTDVDALLTEGGASAGSFADHPALRWGLVASLALVGVGAALLVASDLHAWSRLRWAMPAGAEWLILG